MSQPFMFSNLVVQVCGGFMIVFISIFSLVNSWIETRNAKAEAVLAKDQIRKLLAQVFHDVMLRNWSHPERHFFIRCNDLTTYEAFWNAVQAELKRPPSEIKLYFLPKDRKWTEAREKITDTLSLQRALQEIRESQNFEHMEDQPEIVFHISERSPEFNSLVMPDRLSPLNANKLLFSGSKGRNPSTSSTTSSSTSTSSSSSKKRSSSEQKAFRNELLSRDGKKCVFCLVSGDTENIQLEAAHIIPFNTAPEIDLQMFGLKSINEATNGLLLCHSCHKIYDCNLIGVDEFGAIHVCGALLESGFEKWGQINKIQIKVSAEVLSRSSLCLKHRNETYTTTSEARQIKARDYPFKCDLCIIFHAENEKKLKSHKNSKACKKNQEIIKHSSTYLSQLQTPLKEK